MSIISRTSFEKVQNFINQAKDSLIKPLEEGETIKKGKEKKFSIENFTQIVNQLILNNIIENYSDFEENTKIPDYDLIPYFFHEFIKLYIQNQELIQNSFKEKEISFNWIYNIFIEHNIKSDHFKIKFETIDLLIKNIENQIIDYYWIDTEFLKKNYLELLDADMEYFFRIKNLILMILRLQKRKIIDIKI